MKNKLFFLVLFVFFASLNFMNAQTVNFIPKYNSATTFINSTIFQSTSGNIGIGTTSPTNILSFNGTSARTIWMERHTTANTAGNSLTIQSGGTKASSTNKNGGDLLLKSGIATGTGSSNLIFYTSKAGTSGTTDITPTEKMRITGAGKVGIGTTNPLAKLDLYSDETSYTKMISVNNINTITGRGDMNFLVDLAGDVFSSNGYYITSGINTTANNGISIATVSITGLGIKISHRENSVNTINFTVQENGSIYARSITVTSNTINFPDYVFAKEYKLMTLTELEKFINDSGHLPDVPSANEVKENGINLGDMNVTLLKKIEELTLYTIEQQKQIDELKTKVETLEKK